MGIRDQAHPGIYQRPDPVKVYEILTGYGTMAMVERWQPFSEGYLHMLARKGRKIVEAKRRAKDSA